MECGGGGGLTTHHHETLLSVMVCSVLMLVFVWRRTRPRLTKVPRYQVPTACFLSLFYMHTIIIIYITIIYRCSHLLFFCFVLPVPKYLHVFFVMVNNDGPIYYSCCL